MNETMHQPRGGTATQDTSARSRNSPTRQAEKHSEGYVARQLEEQTAKLPSDVWLWAAVASIGFSLFLRLNNRRDSSLFVGQWAAPFLLIGVYNKIVKIGGSDQTDQPSPK